MTKHSHPGFLYIKYNLALFLFRFPDLIKSIFGLRNQAAYFHPQVSACEWEMYLSQ